MVGGTGFKKAVYNHAVLAMHLNYDVAFNFEAESGVLSSQVSQVLKDHQDPESHAGHLS